MNRLLNLPRLVQQTKSHEQKRLVLFGVILQRCFDQIERMTTNYRITNCNFSVPIYEQGYPAYNFSELVNYLLFHIRDTGILANFNPKTNQIYISWHERDIDLEKYEQRRQRIENSSSAQAEMLLEGKKEKQQYIPSTSLAPVIPQHPPKPKTKANDLINMNNNTTQGNVIIADSVPVNREKFLAAQRRRKEREQRFKTHVVDSSAKKTSFQDFMKRF